MRTGLAWSRGHTLPRKAIAAVLALTALLSFRDAALAQTTPPADISLEAEIGLDGWVELSQPVRLRVTVRSELLFSGAMELRHGRAEVVTPVEVPAGGEKTYELLISPTMATQALTVQLVAAADGTRVASVRVQPKNPTGQILVGSLGFAGELDLPRATSIASVPIVEVRLDDSDAELAVLDYLVVAGGAQVPESVLRWVTDGGRLVVQPGSASALVATPEIGEQRLPGAYSLGAGQILEQRRSIPSNEEWASLLVPFREERHLTDFWGSTEVQMIRAASNSAKAWLPYSGTLVGLVVYAIVVAPVNIIVLRRMRRRELAWITVPAISLVAVIAFVVIGSVQNDSTDWGQATIVAGHGGRSESVSVVAAAANGPLTHTLSTDGGSVMYPAATADAVGAGGQPAVRRVVSGQQVDLVFGDAGYGTVAVSAPTPPLPLVRVEGSSIHVQNFSPYEFEAFGVVAGASVTVASGRLGPGSEVTFEQNGQICQFCNAAEAVADQTAQWNDSRWWQVYQPLSSAATGLVGNTYFFGFVANLPLAIGLNAKAITINGPGLVVVQMEAVDIGQAGPEIVAMSPDGTIQGEGAWRWLSGEWALMEFTVPIDRDITLRHEADMFGPAPAEYEAWDWTAGAFVSVEEGKIEHQRFVDPDGVVLLRIQLGAGENEFFGEFPIGSVSLTWA